MVEALGFVQVDSINVVARAHHLTLGCRFDDYRPEFLTHLLEERRAAFEHWTHDASVIPARWYRHWHHRFARDERRVRESRWWRARMGARPNAVLEAVLRRVEREGPLSVGDFENGPRVGEKGGGWWAWSREKAALEFLWRTGRLAVVRRVSFQKVYDVSERVLPQHLEPPSREDEHLEWAMASALERLGLGTRIELARYFAAVETSSARRWCASELEQGRLVEVEVESVDGSPAKRCVARPDWQARAEALPDAPDRVRLLSPFDPIVRDRARALRLFGFDYRFEAFTPAPRRRFGYYVLPVLEGEALVGRVDLKLRREEAALAVLGLWWEAGVKATRRRVRRLDEALERLAGQLGATRIERGE